MLELTLATQFVPGSNLRGDVTGANWSFLLPTLDLDRVVCWGIPPFTTLTMLAAVGRRVTVCADLRQLNNPVQRRVVPNVDWVALRVDQALPFADGSVDLIFAVDRQRVEQITRNPRLQAEVRRILKAEGRIYFEVRGRPGRLETPDRLTEGLGTPQWYWLTPLTGEMHTAVPLGDRQTRSYFLRRGLFSPSITVHTLNRIKRQFTRRSVSSPSSLKQSAPDRDAATATEHATRGTWRSAARNAGSRLISMAGSAERFLYQHTRFARYGVLIGQSGTAGEGRIPAYLRQIAQEAGINLDQHRWGLWAGGDYSSRKLLFFLFNGTSDHPEYLVKMVRSSAFNRRLENEVHALQALNEMQIGDAEVLPQVVFYGHPHNLAMVGETVIDGIPFRQRTEWSPGCPYLSAAIDWIANLGERTATTSAATSAQVADSLETLFSRFEAIYDLTPQQRDFLSCQIATLRTNPAAFPLVFQHGDPGPWNMLVTPAGRVALLDWESAETQGMPLWDLFYFLRSYAIGLAQVNGTHDRQQAFAQHFLATSPLSTPVIDAVQDYSTRVGLPKAFVEPLFYTCWMHRALKQSTLLEPSKLQRGYYVSVLRLCIEQRDTPTLNRLFSS
jgi:SAM-dependent methyltransferase